jgi:hypothetical protein
VCRLQGDVRAFLKATPKAGKGLPTRPIVGIAVSFQLDLPDSVIADWIGQRLG